MIRKSLMVVLSLFGLVTGSMYASESEFVSTCLPESSDYKECRLMELVGDNDFLLIEYMSTSCGACVTNIPEVESLSIDLAPYRVKTVMMVVDSNELKAKTFFQKKFPNLTVELFFDSKRLFTNYFITLDYTPTTLLVEKKNIIAKKVLLNHVGTYDEEAKAKIYDAIRSATPDEVAN